MTKFDSKKVLAKVRQEITRLNKMKPGIKDLSSMKEELIDLSEIVFSKKADYASLQKYTPPPTVRVKLPEKREPGETRPTKYIMIPSDSEIESRNIKFIKDALVILKRAERKYSLRAKLES